MKNKELKMPKKEVNKTENKEALTNEALQTKLMDLKKEALTQRIAHASGQLPKSHVIRNTRREIARVKTQLNEVK